MSAIAAIDAAIEAALEAGTARTPLLRHLRARRDLLLMTALSTAGVDLPDCAQPSSLAADSPLTAGLDFEREPAFPGHAHGLDLTAALDPRTRAEAGVPGAHLPPAQLAHRNPDQSTGPRSCAQQAPPSISTIVYGDFSNAHCYLASILADRLVGTAAAVEWRAVQHHSRLSFGGLHLDEAAQQCLAAEWREARPLLSEDLIVGYRFRTFVPNTQASVAGFAEAKECGCGR